MVKENPTFEHVLAFTIKNASPGLQVLAAEELGDGQSLGFRWPGSNGLSNALGLLLLGMGVGVSRRAGTGVARLLRLLLLGHAHLYRLLLEVLEELGDGHPGLAGVLCDLALDLLDLLRRGLLAGREPDVGQDLLLLLGRGVVWRAIVLHC